MDRYSMSVHLAHPLVSQRRRLYLHPPNATGPTTSDRLTLLPNGIVVEPYPLRILAADCLFCCCLGFDHATSIRFFLLSSPSRLCIFHHYVVALIALRGSSNSIGYFSYHLYGTGAINKNVQIFYFVTPFFLSSTSCTRLAFSFTLSDSIDLLNPFTSSWYNISKTRYMLIILCSFISCLLYGSSKYSKTPIAFKINSLMQ